MKATAVLYFVMKRTLRAAGIELGAEKHRPGFTARASLALGQLTWDATLTLAGPNSTPAGPADPGATSESAER